MCKLCLDLRKFFEEKKEEEVEKQNEEVEKQDEQKKMKLSDGASVAWGMEALEQMMEQEHQSENQKQ